MPRVTLYIREDDYDKWKLIKNKSELVSQAINRSEITVEEQKNGSLETVQTIPTAPPTTLNNKYPGGLVTVPTEKNNSEGKPSKPKNYCAEHLVSKDVCKLMKHKA